MDKKANEFYIVNGDQLKKLNTNCQKLLNRKKVMKNDC